MEITMNLPTNYQEIKEEEMMYIDGGWSVTINRSTIRSAIASIYGGASLYSFFTGCSAKAIAMKIGKCALSFARYALQLGGFSSFWAISLSGAFAGVVLACAVTIGIVYVTNSSIRLGF